MVLGKQTVRKPAKTNFIIFRSRRKIIPNDGIMAVTINDTEIAQVFTTKFLGVHIDFHLTWCGVTTFDL